MHTIETAFCSLISRARRHKLHATLFVVIPRALQSTTVQLARPEHILPPIVFMYCSDYLHGFRRVKTELTVLASLPNNRGFNSSTDLRSENTILQQNNATTVVSSMSMHKKSLNQNNTLLHHDAKPQEGSSERALAWQE